MTTWTPSPWDLWTLRCLMPEACQDDVIALHQARRRQATWEHAIYRRLLAGDQTPLESGRRYRIDRPHLGSGLVLTLHLGPYQFALEPFLAAGDHLTVLVNADAERRLRPPAEDLVARLDLPGRLDWITVESRDGVRRLMRALRQGGPVLAFADGNQGHGGLEGTRRQGIPYHLPGREIRVRTGLARLICRTGCPVHPLIVRWDEGGDHLSWSSQPTQRWTRKDDPLAVTHRLFDWAFSEVLKTPDQWSYWTMVAETAAAFAPDQDSRHLSPPSSVDFNRVFLACLARASRTVRVELEADLEVWPGDVLADRTSDCFYAAEGLRQADLQPLQGKNPTLAELQEWHGSAWVGFHVRRLCLLGLARLQGEPGRVAV